MKKLLIGVGVVVLLLFVVVAAAPFVAPLLIPVETYKERIAQGARDATGRDLVIAGDFRLSLLPRLELEANDVAFANAPGAKDPQMVTLEKLLVQLQVLPLLTGQVKVDSFVLVEPVIHLEVDKAGKANWQLETAQAGAASESEQQGEQTPGSGGAPDLLTEISLGEVRLERGLLTYSDAAGGVSEEISDINMEIALPDLESPFGAEGSLVWHGEKLGLTAAGENLGGLMAGAATPLALAVESAPVTLSYEGQVTLADVLRVVGAVDLDVPSIRELAAWTGNPIAAEGGGLGPLEIKGQVGVTGSKYAFTDARIALDSMNATGDLTVDTGRARPYLEGRLDVDKLDLNTYLPPPGEADGAKSGSKKADKGPPPEWSKEPIDLSGLKAADADFALSVGAIEVQDMKIGKSALTVALENGVLVTDLTELNLYGGTGKGRIELDGSGKVPAVTERFVIEGVEAEPLLTDAAGFEDLEGTGRFEIAITARGQSQHAMVRNLNGNGTVKFTDGAIKGFNLAAMARNVSSAFLKAGADDTEKTDFAELSGSFKIQKGILRNDDLLLLNPLVRATGAGTADIPKRTLDYRVKPKIVGTLKGQGGEAEASGVTVPVLVQGPWHDLDFKPDLAGMLGDTVKDPGKAVESVTEGLKDLKGGAKKIDPKKALKKLFGN